MIDEGYIKFQASWEQTTPLPDAAIRELNNFRQLMYDHQLIGAYNNGIGFGNISQRIGDSDQFYITGSATGNFRELQATHFSIVTKVDIDQNRLRCKGASIASSESMSHAVIYQTCDWVKAVIHVHDLELWKKLLFQVATTPKSVSYGSPEMAYSIIDLFKNGEAAQERIFAMAGHEEGIFVFGETLEEAAALILSYL
ncbi:MAG: class II aldolase/adducin family protein [Bacteroidota bacterium]